MVKIEYKSSNNKNIVLDSSILEGKRHLNIEEISILENNMNFNEDGWNNFYVDKEDFDPSLIRASHFSGFIVLGKICSCTLSYNDLHLKCGIRNSQLKDIVCGDLCCIERVSYLENYRLGNRVILFNIQEMCCTSHSKFGNGILKEGEPESNRIWIGVANENEGRKILPFEEMIPGDAYIWSHFRDDPQLLKRFVEITEKGRGKELNTYGFVDNDAVIKNCNVIKDVKVGKAAYVKGAFKLKNITICSSEEEVTQVGEGVELVNGILGYGSRVFYQAIGVRFVIGRNCQVKYGARVLNSVLGDNSTVSCCEILNNLIFPFHEQHHNSSFLIATTIMGQSNIASGATIGSNHNSRSPDGEIFAKRGFWPGLCSDFKHNSKFASFVLISKGSYQQELYIPYPFSLVAPGINGNQSVSIIPAWWFMYDMFAIARNRKKFCKRDKRVIKVQHIESDPLAPDTMEEILEGINRIIKLTTEYLKEINNKDVMSASSQEEALQAGKDFLHHNPDADFTLQDSQCQKKYGGVIFKPVKAYKMYRKIVKYFAVRTLAEYAVSMDKNSITKEFLFEIKAMPLYKKWENIGGQVIPYDKVQELFVKIKDYSINSWNDIHNYYDMAYDSYNNDKVRYALYLLEQLYSRQIENFSTDIWKDIIEDVFIINNEIYNDSVASRNKDYTDFYRNMLYNNESEMESVLGLVKDNPFLNELKDETESFSYDLERLFVCLTK